MNPNLPIIYTNKKYYKNVCQPFYPTLPRLADPIYPPFLVETEKPVTGPVDSVHFSLFLDYLDQS